MCVPSYHHCIPVSSTRLNCLFLILLQVFQISAFSVFLTSDDLFLILLLFPVYSKFLQFFSTMVFSYLSKKSWREHKIRLPRVVSASENYLLQVDHHFNNTSKHLHLTFLFFAHLDFFIIKSLTV